MTVEGLAEAARQLGSLARSDVPLGPFTTFRVGGPAALLVCCREDDELATVARVVAGTGVPTLVIGRGSNLLLADRGFPGLVVTLAGSFEAVAIDGARSVVEAGAAVSLPTLARRTAAAGLTGFEWAVGVPGSLGGAVRMNAGGHGSDIAASVLSADVVDLGSGTQTSWSAPELAFGYRTSAIRETQVVVRARLGLAAGDAVTAKAEIDQIVQWRRAHQPGGANAGSTFANPEGAAAGQLIDQSGLRGQRVGTAHVSDKHANFIQVDDGGRAADVVALIRLVRRLVYQRTGVVLHPEIRLAGFVEADLVGILNEVVA